jgi:hypothetical protein
MLSTTATYPQIRQALHRHLLAEKAALLRTDGLPAAAAGGPSRCIWSCFGASRPPNGAAIRRCCNSRIVTSEK